ncbi:MAG TPA: hypothetical protein VFR37_03345 [Longimicrobium sp.]|nr:hypothetical protein [Longimicrobium sp.]
MRTIRCPVCETWNDYESRDCAACGQTLAVAKIEEAAAAIRVTTARFAHQRAVAEGRGFSTIHGCGTTLLDYRPRGDGAWDAVRWVVVFGIPLIPLGGYVIQPMHEDHGYGHHSASFSVLDRFPLTPMRVARTYLLLVVGLLPLVLGWMNARWLNRTVGGERAFFVMLAAMAWAFYFVWLRPARAGNVYEPLPPRRVA